MKRFISTILIAFLLLSTITFLFGCDTDTGNETPGTQETGSQTGGQTGGGSDESSTKAYTIQDFYDVMTQASQLLMKTSDFQTSTWETIYKYPDGKDVEDTFAFLLEKTDPNGTNKQCYERIQTIYNHLVAKETDATMKKLLTNCYTSYCRFYTVVTVATGSYAEYKEEYNEAFDEHVFDYDELVAHLYDIGYFKD